jgi:hypothetical protein
VQSLPLEAVAFVEADRRLIVVENGELDPLDVEPVVGSVD